MMNSNNVFLMALIQVFAAMLTACGQTPSSEQPEAYIPNKNSLTIEAVLAQATLRSSRFSECPENVGSISIVKRSRTLIDSFKTRLRTPEELRAEPSILFLQAENQVLVNKKVVRKC